MTNEQKAQAYLMLLNGATLKEAAETFGVSRQRMQQLFPKVFPRGPRIKCIYPNIKRWIYENCGTQQKFAEMIGVCQKTAYDYLTGRRSPHKEIIDKILEVTGMTYEEAFKQ